MNIVFFGTPEFAQVILEKLIATGYKPSLVVTAPDRPVGRRQILTPPPTKITALNHDIPVLQPEKLDPTFNTRLSSFEPDLIIVAAYGKIIPKKILDIPKHGAINVHPSLLPKWRGASPIQYAILNGDKKTGVTVMLMDEKMDHGPLFSQREFSISDFKFLNGQGKPTTPELSEKLVEIGGDLLVETIPKWVAGKIKPKEQDHEKATYSKIIKKEDGRLDWSKSADELERRVRAFTPWPGSFFTWQDKTIALLDSGVQKSAREKIGKVFKTESGEIAVQTAEHSLVLKTLKPEGKNEMSSKQFLNGHPDILEATLERNDLE